MPPPELLSIELAERSIHRRAIEAVIWGMAAMSLILCIRLNAQSCLRPDCVLDPLPNWKSQTFTPIPSYLFHMRRCGRFRNADLNRVGNQLPVVCFDGMNDNSVANS